MITSAARRGARSRARVAAGILGAFVSALTPTAIPVAAADDASSSRTAVLAQVGLESDADDFGGLLARGGALFDYQSYLQNFGFAVQDTHYSQGGWDEDVPGVIGIYRNQRRDTLEGLRAEAGVVSLSGHARPIGDITWSDRPFETTGIELIAAGDVVGTREALERGISYGLAAASVEQQFGSRLTGIAFAGWQPFTDGNSRSLLRARLILGIAPEEGLSAQVRWRRYSSSKSDVDGAYYNPEHYRNWDAGLSLRRHVGTWTVAGLAGAGRERADNASWQTTTIAELRAEGPLSGDIHLTIGVLYNRAAGFANSPDYWYGMANIGVIIPLTR